MCYYPTPYRSVPPAKVGKSATPKKRKPKKGKSEDEVGKGLCGHGLYGATFTMQMDSAAPHYLAMCYPYTYTELQVRRRGAFRLIQYFDSSAHGLVRRWRLIGYSTYYPRAAVDQVDSHGRWKGPCLQTNPQCDPVSQHHLHHVDESTPTAPHCL